MAALGWALLMAGCAHKPARQVIVLGIDGMDPGFVERHWAALPNLAKMGQQGRFQRLRTTTPPQSPVAWSTFITGLDPGEHGIFDFVHRDPATRELYLSTDRTTEGRFAIPLGPWRIPLSRPRIESLRKGTPFWQTLAQHDIPVTMIRMPTNYPPLPYGQELAGMGTPDLRGTQGTYTWFTDEPQPGQTHFPIRLTGPSNDLRANRAPATADLDLDIDPDQPVARIAAGDEAVVIREGEWSDWLPVRFALLPHAIYADGMVRIYAKQLRPAVKLYVSAVNIDPQKPALPISSPASYAASFGRFYTQGIGEDTNALRQGVLELPEFLTQSRLVLADEQQLYRQALDDFREGFLFFYFSSVDQNSHTLWGRHDDELLRFYQAADQAVGEAARRFPDAALMVLSDHGFTTFDRAVNLNAWIAAEGLTGKAWAAGLNAMYLNGADSGDVRQRLLAMRDPETGRAPIEAVTEVHAAPENRAVAPTLIVGYAPGYRASWATGLGESADHIFDTNSDAWIADHCVDAAAVPGVLFTTAGITVGDPSLRALSRVILGLYGL
jgi:hypothetical protein